MLELWGERNIARLARDSDVPRESVSKILGYKRGIGEEVAAKLAGALNLDSAALLPPATEVVSLASLDRRLQSLEVQIGRAVTLMEEAIQLLRATPARAAQGGRRR